MMTQDNKLNDTGHYITTTTKKQVGVKYYVPNNDLVNFLRTQLHRKKEIEAGRDSLEEDKVKRNNKKDRLKVYYLDKHIFQAMANLAFFFEAIAKHPELEKIYEDDIKDLLGIRRKKLFDKSMRKPLCGFMFYNLLHNILKICDPSRRKEIVKDFRLILNHRAEEIVRKKVSASIPSGYDSKKGGKIIQLVDDEENRVYNNILGDFDRVLGWTAMLKSDIDKSQDVEEKPHRTFNFNTEELLGIKKEKNGESS
jgi:hypothetical protein